MQYNPEQIILAVDSHNGIYAPQIFFERYSMHFDQPAQQWEELSEFLNIDRQEYWQAWDELLTNATLTIQGIQYRVEQNEDIWLIPVDMELPENWYI